ncbi:MAG: MFS transporter [Anaerolineales bacterium]|nr:MFS transporter [Anaerolineales bacterium]
MRRLILPITLGLAHGAADGAAGLRLGRLPGALPLAEVGLRAQLYNLLAFGCQPAFGLLTGQLRRPRPVALAGLGLLAASPLLLPAYPMPAVALAGLGSSGFHVAGGAMALCATHGRASGPGLFAAPGVLGLALGGYLALAGREATWPFLILLAELAGAVALLEQPGLPYTDAGLAEPAFERHDLIMLVLLAAVALRSLVWTTLQYALEGRVEMLLLMAIAAALGKALGGSLADRLGWRRWTLAALGCAAALLTLSAGNLIMLLLGVALLQSATPAALAATLRLLPRQPAIAAGLGLGLAIAAGAAPIAVGWGGALQPAPALAALALAAAAASVLAFTWLSSVRRPAPGPMVDAAAAQAMQNPTGPRRL